MANSNTYNEGFTGTQVTTLSHIQGAGLNLPFPTGQFIDIRSPGKLQTIFETPTNSNTLYTKYKPYDAHLKGPLAVPYTYTSIESGQRNKIVTAFDASLKDAARVTKFLGSSVGTKFILKQVALQGFQHFDETKVYNPASPIIATLRLASFGLLDRPTRHIDTSNIVNGLLGATGLGSIVRTIGSIAGTGESVPSPPRSSVASTASRPGGFLGITGATFTSFLGGGDRSNEVLSPLARPYVKGLLRGGTATNAYNSPRYSKLVASNPGFLQKLLSGVGSFFQNNTLIGGILPPKQPWAANYRADEETYSLYLGSGKLFDSNYTGVNPGGILGGFLNAIGFGQKANYSLSVRQRFFRLSERNKTPNYNRSIVNSRFNGKSFFVQTNRVGIKEIDRNIIGSKAINVEVSPLQNYYTDVVFFDIFEGLEQSDQLLNYTSLRNKATNFEDTFVNKVNPNVENIIDNFKKVKTSISGQAGEKYIGDIGLGLTQQFVTDDIGFNFVNKVKSMGLTTSGDNYTYTGRFRNNDGKFLPSRLGKIKDKDRFIRPTNDVDYVNSLNVLDEIGFKQYQSKNNNLGPDIIKFYFYDIVNERYIPFSATVTGINDLNQAEWETVEYVGRADKLYYYKGFTRKLNFAFKTVAGSIKELMPMWQRINYLTSLTKPANYTDGVNGGFIVPPMVQLTLGDFFKNHFVTIETCNITIDDDATWEILPEDMTINNSKWYWGPNRPDLSLANSKGMYAQFPMSANISMNMSVLEKDRPQAGRTLWGDINSKNKNIFSNNLLRVPEYTT